MNRSRPRALYDLRQDKNVRRLLRESHKLTINSRIAKVSPDFGSHEWWATLEAKGQIQELVGKISRLIASGHGDFPEFELDANGSKYLFERKGNASNYHVGDKLRVMVAARSAVFRERSLDGFVVLRVESLEH